MRFSTNPVQASAMRDMKTVSPRRLRAREFDEGSVGSASESGCGPTSACDEESEVRDKSSERAESNVTDCRDEEEAAKGLRTRDDIDSKAAVVFINKLAERGLKTRSDTDSKADVVADSMDNDIQVQ